MTALERYSKGMKAVRDMRKAADAKEEELYKELSVAQKTCVHEWSSGEFMFSECKICGLNDL